ncbi:hypothetical protein [Tsuneonella sp. HG222]
MKLLNRCMAAMSIFLVSPAMHPLLPLHEATDAVADRDLLIDAANAFIDAIVVHRDVASLSTTRGARWTENGSVIDASESRLVSAQTIGYRLIFADELTGQVAFYGAVSEPGGGRAAVFVRLKTVRREIAEVEIVHARQGEASLFRPEAMTLPDPIYAETVPADKRNTRAALIAAAQAYYDGIEAADGSRVPAAPGCYRVENGVDTHIEPSLQLSGHCNAGLANFTWIKPVRDRRFPIVDEERGLVWAIVVMDIAGGPYQTMIDGRPTQAVRPPRSIIVGELFKVVGGRIRRMEVVMRNVPYGSGTGWAA